MRKFRPLLIASAILAATPMLAQAESQFTGTGNATARLDFQITVPRVLYLRVGTGTDYTNNAAINQIAFTVPAATMGDGTPVAASAASGDLGNGVVTARVLGNNGTITLSSTTTGALSNGAAGDTISCAQIATAATTLTSATVLPAPNLADGATNSVTVTPVAGRVVTRDARWTYTYANSAVVAPGTYGGVNANNSRVTYTAAMP